jgi:hypothetical protein
MMEAARNSETSVDNYFTRQNIKRRHMNQAFIHSQALIVQDGPLVSLSGFLDHTHIQTHGRTPLDE